MRWTYWFVLNRGYTNTVIFTVVVIPPGTSERICLIVGTVASCYASHDAVAQIVSDRPDPQPKPGTDGDGKINYQRHQQVCNV